MNFTANNCQQRTPEWFAARLGMFTSSDADLIFKEGRAKGSESVQKRDLRIRLALEYLTKQGQQESIVTKDMQRGIDLEPIARGAYQALTGSLVRRSGFLAHNVHKAGCSLDGYVGNYRGIVEFKCPKTATHLEYIRENQKARRVPADYEPQIRHHLWITGAEWADFCSFDDRMPERSQLLIVRVTREQMDIPGYEKAAIEFIASVAREADAIAALDTIGLLTEAA